MFIKGLVGITLVALSLEGAGGPEVRAAAPDDLEKGRALFALAVDDRQALEEAMAVFRRHIDGGGAEVPLATVYLGALYVLKARHSFWPFDKLKYAEQGLEMMARGVARAPEHLEGLFVQGAVCARLPALFGRRDDAERNFRRIIALLPEHRARYDPATLGRIVAYLEGLEGYVAWNPAERATLLETKRFLQHHGG